MFSGARPGVTVQEHEVEQIGPVPWPLRAPALDVAAEDGLDRLGGTPHAHRLRQRHPLQPRRAVAGHREDELRPGEHRVGERVLLPLVGALGEEPGGRRGHRDPEQVVEQRPLGATCAGPAAEAPLDRVVDEALHALDCPPRERRRVHPLPGEPRRPVGGEHAAAEEGADGGRLEVALPQERVVVVREHLAHRVGVQQHEPAPVAEVELDDVGPGVAALVEEREVVGAHPQRVAEDRQRPPPAVQRVARRGGDGTGGGTGRGRGGTGRGLHGRAPGRRRGYRAQGQS
jgi:hypothetical protein